MLKSNRSRSVKLVVGLAFSSFLTLGLSGLVFAQDDGAAAPAADPAAVPAEGSEAKQLPEDPTDKLVGHIEAMTKVVRDNMDTPDKVKSELSSYIKDNGDAMREAGESFEKRLESLSADEAEAYNESVQRRMETALESFMTTMIEFAERHPEAAKELDAMLQEQAK